MRLPRRAKKSRFKASQLPPGCLRCRRHRRAFRATIFRIRERLRIACALSLLTVFKFVAIMRQSATNGKRNTATRRGAPAFGASVDVRGCVSAVLVKDSARGGEVLGEVFAGRFDEAVGDMSGACSSGVRSVPAGAARRRRE